MPGFGWRSSLLFGQFVHCVIQASNQGCYYTAASGTANNAASTLTYANVPVTGISAPTMDALAPGALWHER
jgi:hypothetical protein